MPPCVRITALLLLLAIGPSSAQDSAKSIRPLMVPRRVALVIGNGDYRFIPGVPPAQADADDMAQVLRTLGFEIVEVYKDLGAEQMIQTVGRFVRSQVRPGDLALIYYSGHGGQVNEENYLLPVDYDPPSDEDLVDRRAYRMSMMRDALEGSSARVRVLIFDACRSSPVVNHKAAAPGLRGIEAKAEGTLIAYASAHNQVARYEGKERNSVYTSELLTALRQGSEDLKALFEDVQHRVYERTEHRQTPYLYGFLSAPLYLREPPAGASQASNPDGAVTDAWNIVKDSGRTDLFEAFIREFPNSMYSATARLKISALTNSPAGPPRAVPAPNPPADDASMKAFFEKFFGPNYVSDTPSPRSMLGVSVAALDAQKLAYTGQPGVVVAGIEAGGIAQKAGVRQGDIIVSIGGLGTPTPALFSSAVVFMRPGDTVTFDARHRNDNGWDAYLVSAQMPGSRPPDAHAVILGLTMEPLDRQKLRYEGAPGVLLQQVHPGSLGQKAGLKPGDIVTSINGMETSTDMDLVAAAGSLKTGDVILFKISRQNAAGWQPLFLTVKATER